MTCLTQKLMSVAVILVKMEGHAMTKSIHILAIVRLDLWEQTVKQVCAILS